VSPRFGRGEPKPDEGLLSATVDVLAGTLGLRDGSTGEHSDRVVDLAQRIGERLGLERRELRDLNYAARLHDIGKVGVPDAVLFKAGPLDGDEREVIQHHSVAGAELIGELPGLEPVARVVRHHHENYDGSGYPDGLSGRDIPLSSRILSVADAYAAMTEDRPYRRARPRFEVDQEFMDCSGSQFDPYVVAAMREVVAQPAGNL
jgi:HD-GYP domain-containing protein (c-di-GMP phosphodiesterase class II)